MLLKSLSIFSFMSILATTPCLAQTNTEKTSGAEIGATVLHQDGDKKYSHENGTYSYEKVIDISGTSKKELYDRAKKWIIANLKTPQESLFFDDTNHASITANTAVHLKDNLRLTSQIVEFKLSFSFKDDKVRIQGDGFVYRSIYPGAIYQKPFNDLRPFSKNVKRTIYEEFDEQFDAMQKGLSTALKNNQADNW